MWYTKLNEGLIYSCSDDCTFKCLDSRAGAVAYTVKGHEAGVTWLGEGLMKCSYDGTVRLWEPRMLKEVKRLEFKDKALWDIKRVAGGIGIAAIYDGYFFSKPRKDDASTEELFDLSYEQYTGHGSICYAFEPCNNHLLTTSFYDNTV